MGQKLREEHENEEEEVQRLNDKGGQVRIR
jgi:hypothetical protein